MTFATASVLFTFTLEWSLRKWIRHSNQKTLAAAASAACSTVGKDEEMDIANAADLAEQAETLENVVIAYTFEAGIIFHSTLSHTTSRLSPAPDVLQICLGPTARTGKILQASVTVQ